jgi:uncharacterized membrane protein
VNTAAVLAILSAATFGAADFLGGLAARRASTIAAVVVSQAAGLILLAVLLPLLPTADVTTVDMAWGAAAGLAGGVGVAWLYRALAIGTMSIVAPVTALLAVIVPVSAGLIFGERLTMMTSAGVGLAIAAIVLVSQVATEAGSRSAGPTDARAALRLAIMSGIAIGLFLVALERTRTEAGLWPLVAARAVSISLFVAIGRMRREPVLLHGRVATIAITGGVLDMLANVLYLVAVRSGQLSVVATLTSLYPASTAILARVVLAERMSTVQIVGVLAAVLATVLIVAGSS